MCVRRPIGFPPQFVPFRSSVCCSLPAALSAQCVYDAYWLTRLVSSVKRYRASYKAGDDKGDSPGEKEHEAILKRQASH